MGKYPAYKSYKDSGVEWLEEIPEHWKAIKLKYLIKDLESGVSVNATDHPCEEDEFGILKTSCVYTYNFVPQENKKIWDSELNRANIHPRKNSLIISRMNTPDLVGASGYVEKDYPNLFLPDRLWQTVFHSKTNFNVKYLAFVLKSFNFRKKITSIATGSSPSMKNISKGDVLNLFVSLAPLEEQKTIARFLDYKTKQIDALIAKKEALLEKIDEKRTALISHAVTKGLDATVPMKDSGIEWLGEIPEHWKRGNLNYFCHITSGGTPDRNNPDFWQGDIPWIKTGEVNYKDIYLAEEYITKEGLNYSPATLVKPETLLMAMYGQGNTRGRVAILKIEAAFNQACLAVSTLQELSVYFLYYYLIRAYRYIRDTGNESSQMNLSAGIISKIQILVPNLEEQKEIVKYLDRKTAEIDAQKAKIQQAIDLLKEYRTALITNAVTGKIDVRQVKVPLASLSKGGAALKDTASHIGGGIGDLGESN